MRAPRTALVDADWTSVSVHVTAQGIGMMRPYINHLSLQVVLHAVEYHTVRHISVLTDQ
jgi:hypothetical protein